MAFVNDPTEEELQRALAMQGASPTVSSGPAGAPAGAGAPSGPAVPQGSAPTAAPGAEQGTGFVNLARYFDANAEGAGKMATGLMRPLEVDTKAIGDAAAAAVPMPTRPIFVDDPSNPAGGEFSSGGPTAEEIQLAMDAQFGTDTAAAKAMAEEARRTGIRDAGATQLETARGIVNDPLKRDEAMTVGGKTPSAFDSYLTGAAIQPAYQGLRDYYGVGGDRADPSAPPDNFTGRGYRPPGTPGALAHRPGTAPPAGFSRPGTGGTWAPTTPPPLTAAASMDPQLRKKNQNAGGW